MLAVAGDAGNWEDGLGLEEDGADFEGFEVEGYLAVIYFRTTCSKSSTFKV